MTILIAKSTLSGTFTVHTSSNLLGTKLTNSIPIKVVRINTNALILIIWLGSNVTISVTKFTSIGICTIYTVIIGDCRAS